MATTEFKAALNAAKFPLSYKQASRTVLIPGSDIAPQTRQAFYGSMDNVDFNLIQLLYCENVMPVARGIQSIGYDEQYPPYSPAVTDFDMLITIKNSINDNASFCPARGKNYVYSILAPNWVSYNPFTFDPDYNLVTYGYVNGRTLIFYERTKLIEWTPSVPEMTTLTLNLPAGFAITDIRGNSAASNYHLLFTEVDILWSSQTDVLDFDDPAGGSGRQIPIDLKGKITSVRPIAGGFLIYTTENVVGASFTNDASRPFAFREVQNSKGVASGEQITGEANATGHYAYGSGGLQLLTLQRAETIFPEVADFLVSRETDRWDTASKTIFTETLPQTIQPKLSYLGSRYLMISYGSDGFFYEFLLVYDTALERWGKLRVNHIDCGELPLGALGSSYYYYTLEEGYEEYEEAYEDMESGLPEVTPLRQNFGFMDIDGRVQRLVMQRDAATPGGLAIFGHIQLVRSREVTVVCAELDGLFESPAPELTLLGSETGYVRDNNMAMEVVIQDPQYGLYHSRHTCKNIDVAIEGKFLLTSMILEAIIHGKK